MNCYKKAGRSFRPAFFSFRLFLFYFFFFFDFDFVFAVFLAEVLHGVPFGLQAIFFTPPFVVYEFRNYHRNSKLSMEMF